MLCILCQGIRLDKLVAFETEYDDKTERCKLVKYERAYQHHANFTALCTSAHNECSLCLLISQVLEEEQTWNNDDRIYGSAENELESDLIIKLRTNRSAQIYICLLDGTIRQDDAGIFEIVIIPTFANNLPKTPTIPKTLDTFFWRALEVWTHRGERINDLKGYARCRLISPDPLSNTATRIFKEWFSTCQISHPGCHADAKYTMPRRLIDVGPSDGSRTPRLYRSGAQHGQWATLSHCWGKTGTLKLTSATLEKRIQGISMAEMPRNFREAIIVTRLLDIQYLWIDSLCIIQDSAEDWMQESAKMGDIYKNSVITIAATNAVESTAGFLRKRRAGIFCRLHRGDGASLPVYVRPRIEWYGFEEIVGPLTQRAWVLQERLLAARTLHFGGQQIIWQCQTKTLAEGFHDTDPVVEEQIPGGIEGMLRAEFHAHAEHSNAESGSTHEIEKSSLTLNISPNPPGWSYHMRDNIYDQWYHVVGTYAGLKLTKYTDKLPAIAGIARQVQLRTGDTYLAGLWKSDIERGLQWYCDPPSVMAKTSTTRAPSWSWAALDLVTDQSSAQLFGTINLLATGASLHHSYEHSVQLLDYSPSLTANGCLGSASGSIVLLGLWTDVKLATALNAPLNRFAESYPTPLILQGHSETRASARLDVAEDPAGVVEMGCLQIGKFRYAGPKYPTKEFISVLLLRRINLKEDIDGRYVRIGLAVLFDTCDPLHGWTKRVVEVV